MIKMTSISKLITSFERNSKEFPFFLHDIMVNNNDVLFDNEQVIKMRKLILEKINSYMNETEYRGLIILDTFLSKYIYSDSLSLHGLFWINKTTEILGYVQSTQELTLTCKVLGCLIIRCKEIPELQKHISMHNVKQLINALSILQVDAKCGAVYYLVAVLLYHYPEVCERFQGLIRDMIFLQIDSVQENLVNASANCYVLLSKATERSFKSSSIHTGWTYNEALLCKSLHIIMDELFVEEFDMENIDIKDKLELPPISDSNIIEYYSGQKQRFSNLCVYLSSMLRGYEAKNSVLPHDILKVLCRGLAITPLNIKSETSAKEQMLYMILPKLHVSLLTVLNAFINGFARELIPFGKTILHLFQQTLRWTNTVLSKQTTLDGGQSFRNVKIYTYKCLSSWLIHTGSLSGIETIIDKCDTFILKDILPEKNHTSLITQPEKLHHKTVCKSTLRRWKNSQQKNIFDDREISTKHILDVDSCREALITLQNILFSGGTLLKKIFYKNVQNTIIELLYDFYFVTSQSFYKNHDCRLELFKVLKAFQMNPDITSVAPIQHYLEISQMAVRDIDLRIVQEAKLASTELEKIVHPIGPTLQLSRQEKSDNESVPKNQVEEIATTSTSDKRRRIEEESPQNTDAISSVSKRPKIILWERVENTKHLKMFNSVVKINKSQVDENLSKDIEEEGIEDVIQDKIYRYEESHKQYIDKVSNITENGVECELTTYDNTEQQKQSTEQEQKEQDIEQKRQEQDTEQEQKEQDIGQEQNMEQEQQEQDKEQEQPKNLLSCTDQTSKTEEKSPPNITREIQWEILQNHQIESEQWNADILESIKLFHSEV